MKSILVAGLLSTPSTLLANDAVVGWVNLQSGAHAYSAPMPYSEAIRLYRAARSQHPNGYSAPSVWQRGSAEFEEAFRQWSQDIN